MTTPRLTGTHHHLFDNLADVQTDGQDEGDVLTLDEDLNPVWAPPPAAVSAMRFYVPFGSGNEEFEP